MPLSSPALADSPISLDAKKLTRDFHLSLPLIAALDRDACLVRGGETASPELQAMAGRGGAGVIAGSHRQDPVAQLNGILR